MMAVYKSNFLVEQDYKIDLCAQRVLYGCLALMYQGDIISPDDVFEIDVEKYATFYNLSIKTAYADILKASISLKNSDIHIPEEYDTDKIHIVSWVSEVIYRKNSYYLGIKWHPTIIPYISGFHIDTKKDGTKIWRGNVTKLTENICKQQSVITIRLYEILKRHEFKGRYEISVQELKEKLQLLESEVNKYKLYADFKKRVILKSLKEIISLTGMQITFKEKMKFGKKVDSIIFIFGD